MVRIETDDSVLSGKAEKIAALLAAGSFDAPVESAAQKSRTEIVLLTPKKWTGSLRNNWKVSVTGPGERLLFNSSKVMKWIENGTGNAGTPTSRGGYIYPATKKFLFIPLTGPAAIGGWKKGMTFGKDFVLARRVRGIQARHIVANFRPRAREILVGEMRNFLKQALT